MTAEAGPVFVGVDGGGTATRALVVDAGGRPLTRVKGPGSLVDPGHPEAAAVVVARTVGEALTRLGSPAPVAGLHAALAGAGREEVRAAAERALERALERQGIAVGEVRVGTDVEAAFHDAFRSGPGLLLVAGTGSVAWGRSEDGVEGRAGGWGRFMGDEGSGWAIGLDALRAVARATDGRAPPTALESAIQARLGVAGPDELIPWVAGASKADVAGLTDVVTSTAAAGDVVAGSILDGAARALLDHVRALTEQLGPWTAHPRVAVAGGLLVGEGALRGRVREGLVAEGLTWEAEAPDGARGAAELARARARGQAASLPRRVGDDGATGGHPPGRRPRPSSRPGTSR